MFDGCAPIGAVAGAVAGSRFSANNAFSRENTVMRNASKISRDFWDYTTLDPKLLDDAARLTEKDIEQMGRPGFIGEALR